MKKSMNGHSFHALLGTSQMKDVGNVSLMYDVSNNFNPSFIACTKLVIVTCLFLIYQETHCFKNWFC